MNSLIVKIIQFHKIYKEVIEVQHKYFQLEIKILEDKIKESKEKKSRLKEKQKKRERYFTLESQTPKKEE